MNSLPQRRITTAFKSIPQMEGMGAKVKRSIGSIKMRQLDPFLLLDDFSVPMSGGFPDHPHRGFETVTYMLSGSFKHEDFIGNSGVLNEGDLQWMTAGRGIVHAEMPNSELGLGLQLWINLPRKEKMVMPKYQEIKKEKVPVVSLLDDQLVLKVIAGKSNGISGTIQHSTGMMYYDYIYTYKKPTEYKEVIPAGFNVFVYILKGKVSFNDKEYDQDSFLAFELLKEESVVSIKFTENCRFVMIGGMPLNEPVVQHGPFVMNTREEIQQAFEDYSMGRNGFENAPTFQSKIGHSR